MDTLPKRLDPAMLRDDDVSSTASPASERHPPGMGASVHVARFDWLYDNSFMSDVKLRVGAVEGWEAGGVEEVYAHRCVLATHSLTYRSMFESGWSEGTTPVIDMQYSKEACHAVLRHIYCCETHIAMDTALEVLDAAVFYQLGLLRDATVRFLKTRISHQTIFSVLQAALLYDDRPLADHCVAFARQTNLMSDVLYSDELCKVPHEVLLLLVEEAVIDSDLNILKQVHRWCTVHAQGGDTGPLLEGFLQFVNFTRMTGEELAAVEEMNIVPVDVLYTAFKNKVLGVGEPAQRRGAIQLRWDETHDAVCYGENNLRKRAYSDGWDVVVALNKFSKGKHYWVFTVHELKQPHDCLVGVTQCRIPPQADPFLADDKGTVFYEPCCNKVKATGCTVTKHADKDDWLTNPATDIGVMVNFDDATVAFYHHMTKTLLYTVQRSPLPGPLYPYAAIYHVANGGVSMSDTTTYLADRTNYHGLCDSCGSKSPSPRMRSPTAKPRTTTSPSAG